MDLVNQAKEHLKKGKHRLAEILLRKALATFSNAEEVYSDDADGWISTASCLIEALLKQPSLSKLIEAELLMWRCFELTVQSLIWASQSEGALL